jgi:hypothetical protein
MQIELPVGREPDESGNMFFWNFGSSFKTALCQVSEDQNGNNNTFEKLKIYSTWNLKLYSARSFEMLVFTL